MSAILAAIVALAVLIVPSTPAHAADLCKDNRPPVRIAVEHVFDNDTVLVTIIPTRTAHIPANRVYAVRYTELRNVEALATPLVIVHQTGPFIWTAEGWNNPAGATQFVMFRDQAGPMQVAFTAVDACGDWPSFVGIPPQVQPSRAPRQLPDWARRHR